MSAQGAHYTECLKSELDLFADPQVQISHVDGRWVENLPTGNYSDDISSPIIFQIAGSEQGYIDLANSYIKFRFQIVGPSGELLDDTAKVGCINLCAQTVFNQVEFFMNDKQVSEGTSCYAYRAIMETMLSYSEDAKRTHLQGSLFIKDTPTATPAEQCDQEKNAGMFLRGKYAKTGVDVFGRLHIDMFNQPRYLLNNVDLHIKLTRNSNAFVLMSQEANANYKYRISNVKLVTRRVTIADSVMLAHQRVLSTRSAAKYPISRVQMAVFSLPAGINQFEKDNLFHGAIPSKICVGFVAADSYAGTMASNPFYFEDFGLSSIDFLVDDKPVAPIRCNFQNNGDGDAFFNMLQGCHIFSSAGGNGITRRDFQRGSALFLFNNTPDLCPTKTMYRRGSTKLSLKFRQSTPKVISMIILSETDQLLSVGADRSVSTDFAV